MAEGEPAGTSDKRGPNHIVFVVCARSAARLITVVCSALRGPFERQLREGLKLHMSAKPPIRSVGVRSPLEL